MKKLAYALALVAAPAAANAQGPTEHAEPAAPDDEAEAAVLDTQAFGAMAGKMVEMLMRLPMRDMIEGMGAGDDAIDRGNVDTEGDGTLGEMLGRDDPEVAARMGRMAQAMAGSMVQFAAAMAPAIEEAGAEVAADPALDPVDRVERVMPQLFKAMPAMIASAREAAEDVPPPETD